MTIYVPLGQLMDFSILSFFPGYSSQMPSISYLVGSMLYYPFRCAMPWFSSA
ncbi:hypothetical protein PISMIDRAFT_674539 [Pisolithus microcarpus 441]|uniref:Uncharacterized protein n=1 Tax=Pisolithus microcarpus 441 TaxID=765257 RepID=A0A0C9ZZH1_9AGAM|nr:hypothetical protein PISMIDRAFT_674539 [Pisolithus microcarpus 441]